MEIEKKIVFEKKPYLDENCFQPCLISAHYDKIISVPYVVLCSCPVFHILVKPIHVDVYQKLGGQVTQMFIDFGLHFIGIFQKSKDSVSGRK